MTNKKRISIGLVFVYFLSLLPIYSANAGELNLIGATVKWSDKIYIATGCSNYDFNYANNTGIKLLNLAFYITDEYGDQVVWRSESLDNGISGTWNIQICNHQFKSGIGPYNTKLTIKDYAGTQRQVEGQITFLARPGATSTSTSKPSTSLDVTSQIAQLTKELNTLKIKLAKVCSVKPKPKYC
jgi:hypothetical protein